MVEQDIKGKDVHVIEVLEVGGLFIDNTVPENVCIEGFIAGVTVVSDLGVEDHPEGVCIVPGVDIVSNGVS